MSIIRDAYGNDNILQRICKLIGVFDKLDEEKKFEKFDKEFETFREFFLNQDVLFIFYLYKDNTDTEQCIDSDTFFSIIKWMVKNRELLKKNVILNEKYEEFLRDYRKAEMGYYEGLQKLNNPVDRIIYSAREQNIRREELEQLIMKSNNLSTNEERYLKGHNRYYKSFYYTALSIYNSHFTDIPEEEIEKIIEEIDKSNFIEGLVTSNDNKILLKEDTNFIHHYIQFVIKVKAIFKPESLYEDKVVKAFWEGKISKRSVIKQLFDQEKNDFLRKNEGIIVGPIMDYENVFRELLKQDEWEGEDFYLSLINHFLDVEMSFENIRLILKCIIPIISPVYAVELLAKIDKCELVKKSSDLMDLLRAQEDNFLKGNDIRIPFEYALKSIPSLIHKEMRENLITLVHSNFYNEEQKSILTNELKRNGFITGGNSSEEMVEFNENEKIEETLLKIKSAYSIRQLIPLEIAKKVIKSHVRNTIVLDEELLKACVTSIISNLLKQQNIDIKSNVFFGKHNKTLGYNISGNDFEAIWINDSLINSFLEKGNVKLFFTMFHEMRHSIQNRKMENGEIDFSTYNFIKERILWYFDVNFYDANGWNMFIEEDARVFGMVDALNFLKELDILSDEDLKIYYEQLKKEINTNGFKKHSKKESSFQTKSLINISNYLGRIIKYNPGILNEYDGILKIEYNIDGTTKDIPTLLKEYKALGEMDEAKHRNMFSIYHGIISSKLSKNIKLPDEVEEELAEFMKEKEDLITINDFRHYYQNYYWSQEPSKEEDIARGLVTQRGTFSTNDLPTSNKVEGKGG